MDWRDERIKQLEAEVVRLKCFRIDSDSPAACFATNADSVKVATVKGEMTLGKRRRYPSKAQIVRYRRSLSTPDTLTALKPSESEILGRAVEALQWKDAECRDTWFGSLLPRLGHNRALDLAANALTTVTRLRYGAPGITRQACYETVARALPALRDSINCGKGKHVDEVMAAIALLASFEALATEQTVPSSTHMDAMVMVCVRRKPSHGLSDLAKGLLDYFYCDMSIRACVRGTVSSLEQVVHEHYRSRTSAPLHGAAALKAVANELAIRLPRLIAMVRDGCGHSPAVADTSETALLANELLELEAKAAENDLLHHVGLVPTFDPGDAEVIDYSFDFNCIGDFEAAITYWQYRLTLLRLCIRQNLLNQTATPSTTTTSDSSTTDVAPEARRLAANLFMSIPHARTLTLPKRKRLLAHSIVVLWGAIEDIPGARPTDCESAVVKGWLLWHVNDALFAKHNPTSDLDMDRAAELFMGGPLVGRYADLFRQPG
ncbi:hypothetical protein BAUCODRAFT_24441 [Baudoinia panamericana UAMH 10762]|uniref:Uncharacterized protein n=1 Tax=Baudoinia panamericana (strain UAMH 10762) TaxID=717646 RepID=M2NC32_BAUPA|nr:uncharacterized protein BAUCODRAFT_24441 [Baudoinia panamericana UAMH 10762]EMC96729.1 hypothetical protein BAUCODRAFT_24441 [Baudoinia panamericana UAMH 10762]